MAGPAGGVDSGSAPWGQPCQRDEQCVPGICRGGLCRPADGGRPGDLGREQVDAAGDGTVGPGDGGAGDLGRTRTDGAGMVDGGLPSDVGTPCTFDTDCPIPFICGRRGVCIPQCVEDRDCPADQLCHQGGCRAPGGACLAAADCLPGEICHLRRCRPEPECLLAGDCPAGQRCVDGSCTVDSQVDAGTPPGPDGGGGDPLCPPRGGRYGEACDCAEQCQSGLCLDTGLLARAPVCTKSCSLRDPCPGIDLCAPLGDGAQVCVTNDAGLPCRGEFECLVACMSLPGTDQAACTVPCEGSRNCPQGWGCGPVLTDQGVLRICLPAGGFCLRGSMCAGQRCLPHQPGDGFGFCTLDCRNALDCPAGWSCCAVVDQDEWGNLLLVRVCYDGPVCP
ncbi:MAG: hypothetical protein FJ125_06710 [Deltaproteobacteria bacterium]|nr:hypothetical protein [Deltaproteobacteria bacterium]